MDEDDLSGERAWTFAYAELTKAFGHHCGLNADWSVTAWQVSKGRKNIDRGFYIIDDEMGNIHIVLADFDEQDRYNPEAKFVVDGKPQRTEFRYADVETCINVVRLIAAAE
jgi:hypothetical protein